MLTDNSKKQCFTSIQSRKVLGDLESCQLCPSMDLILYGTSTTKQQNLYRTVSWQKVASIISPSESPPCTSWSPNGRWIAMACDSEVSLYGVEPLANPPGGFAATTSPASEAQHKWTVSCPIVGLSWMHVGRPHPTAWDLTDEEREEEISWRYQSRYADKSVEFLPPSAYLQKLEEDDHHSLQEISNTTSAGLPECQTPLSILCVSTNENLELYLHGRYPLLSISRQHMEPPQVVASTDLCHFLVYSEARMSLYHLPFLREDRYPLQTIASLHSSIFNHLNVLKQSIPEVLNSWKSSLKPLDTKLKPLNTLLEKYGVDCQPIGAILRQYILLGHTSDSSSVANAMDQFFTSIQMNDQLLVRMERTLHGSLANVESLARKGLISPSQALCLQVQELAGLVQFHTTTTASDLHKLIDASHQLWVSVEALLTSIVECRFRVRDLCSWLRSTGSQIKARGTASKSVQRENARNRRVSQAVVERLISLLDGTWGADKQASLTERLLKMNVSNMLKEDFESFISTSNSARPSSPSSVTRLATSTPTVAFALRETQEACSTIFANPLANIPQSVVPKDLVLPQFADTAPTLVATHMRVGRDATMDCSDNDEEELPTYFLPTVEEHSISNLPQCFDCRQWAIVSHAHRNIIQFYCLPLGCKNVAEHADSGEDCVHDIPFYLTTKLVLPSSGLVKQLGFYSDDGKSSLSSGDDSGSGKEGHQKLGLLFQEEEALELWLLSYESLLWQPVHFESILMDPSEVNDSCTRSVRAMPDVCDEDEELLDNDILWAQTRTILGLDSADATSKLLLCGSRGVGCIAVAKEGVTMVELLDLEEDEESEEDDEFDEAE